MDAFANDTPEHRDEAFSQAAAELGFAKAIVEKDFWVCWSLRHLFALPSFGDHLIFKGGTSLSKAFDVIPPFSMRRSGKWRRAAPFARRRSKR